MVDKIKIFIAGSMSLWVAKLEPIMRKNGKAYKTVKSAMGDIISYSFKDMLGFQIMINNYGLTIENSLHKAYNVLNGTHGNFNYFGYAQLFGIISYLSNEYQFDISSALIKKLELGINIGVSKKPEDYINCLYSFGYTKPCDLMRNKNTAYGKKIYMSQYSIKLYDKTYQHYRLCREKLNQNIVRFELEYHNISTLKRHIVTLADLLDRDSYIELTNLLSLKFSKLQFREDYNLEYLTQNQLVHYYAGRDYGFWKELAKRNKSTLATKKRRYQALIQSIENNQSNESSLILELRIKTRKAIYDLV